jgi:hypothetical protein
VIDFVTEAIVLMGEQSLEPHKRERAAAMRRNYDFTRRCVAGGFGMM